METVFEYGEYTFPLDLADADTAERYEAAFAKMAEDEQALAKETKLGAAIRAYCAMFRRLFDGVFREGAGESLIPRDNQDEALAAYNAFLDFVTAQQAARQRARAETLARFSPARAERTAKK